MLMLFIEGVVKLSQLQEEFTMLLNTLLNHDSLNQSFCAKFKHQMMLWVVFIRHLLKEEVLFKEKNQLWEHHLLLLRPTYLSLNHLDSLNT